MKSNLYGGFVYPVSDQVQLQSTCYFIHQGVSNEFITSAIVKVNLEEDKGVEGGIIYRSNDAVAIYTGYQLSNWMVGISYDVNVSGLTNGNGAFELTLTYQPKAKVKEPKKLVVKENQKAIKDSIAKQVMLTAEVMAPNEAKPIVVKEKELKITKQQRVPLTKPLIISDKEDIVKVESKSPVIIANNTEEVDAIKALNKVELTAPLVIEERENIATITPKHELKVIETSDNEQSIIRENHIAITAPLVIADRDTELTAIADTKLATPITVDETEINVMPIEKISLTSPLFMEEREEISQVIASKNVQVIPEDTIAMLPAQDEKVVLTAPLEIPEQEIVVRDSAPELIKKNVEMVIITESDDDLQIAVSPAEPLTTPKYDAPSISDVSANYMTFKQNSAVVDQIQVIDVVEPVYDSLWFNSNYQVTLVADSRDKEQLSLPRLKAVQNVLIKKGVSKDRIKLVLKDDTIKSEGDNYQGAVYLKVQSVK
jgi:hypothetical protein